MVAADIARCYLSNIVTYLLAQWCHCTGSHPHFMRAHRQGEEYKVSAYIPMYASYMRDLLTVCVPNTLARDAFTILANTHPEKVGMSAIFAITGQPRPPPTCTQRHPIDHRHLRFWSRKSWKEATALAHSEELCDKHGTPLYLENRDGTVISAALYTHMRTQVKHAQRTLEQGGMATRAFGHLSREAKEYVRSVVYEEFPGIEDSETSWKFQVFVQRVWPDCGRDRTTDNADVQSARLRRYSGLACT